MALLWVHGFSTYAVVDLALREVVVRCPEVFLSHLRVKSETPAHLYLFSINPSEPFHFHAHCCREVSFGAGLVSNYAETAQLRPDYVRLT